MKIKKLFYLLSTFILGCASEIQSIEKLEIKTDKNDYVIGESMTVKYNNINAQDKLKISIIDNYKNVIKDYSALNGVNNNVYISRILDGIKENIDINNLYMKYDIVNDKSQVLQTYYSKLNIMPSISIVSICSSNLCEGVSGNIIEDIPFKIKIKTFGNLFNEFRYSIFINDKLFYEKNQNIGSYTDFDVLQNVKMPIISEKDSSYIALIKITALDNNNITTNFAETVFPIRVVRPIEIKYFGRYELAQTYEPIPVTGCIPGTLSSRVEYSESTSETRQNSISIVIGKDFAISNSDIITNTNSDEISLGETINTNIASENATSLSNEETITNSVEETNGSNFSFSTTDGENWAWSTNQTNTTEQTESSNNEINGEVTTTVTGEGSLPFLAKASGSVSGTVGALHGWSNSTSNSQSNERGYITGQNQDRTREFGSVNQIAKGSSLSGSYAFTNTNSYSVEEGNSQSSTRVWNMSESVESGKIVTEGDSESIDNTIVSSSTSETTFSYSGFIPNGRVGKFFRQTSRYTKLSEIITYDIDGYKTSAGYISMNSWAWAPELVISDSCQDLKYSDFLLPACYIEPCGE